MNLFMTRRVTDVENKRGCQRERTGDKKEIGEGD